MLSWNYYPVKTFSRNDYTKKWLQLSGKIFSFYSVRTKDFLKRFFFKGISPSVFFWYMCWSYCLLFSRFLRFSYTVNILLQPGFFLCHHNPVTFKQKFMGYIKGVINTGRNSSAKKHSDLGISAEHVVRVDITIALPRLTWKTMPQSVRHWAACVLASTLSPRLQFHSLWPSCSEWWKLFAADLLCRMHRPYRRLENTASIHSFTMLETNSLVVFLFFYLRYSYRVSYLLVSSYCLK